VAAGERGAAAAAAAEEEGVAAADELEGAPFPDPGNDDDDDDEDDDEDDESGDARAATRRWERTGERGRGSRGVEEVELSAACIAAEEDAADVIAAGSRSAVALLRVAAGAAQAAETTPLLF
jgi:hypothetical protein